jgi:hypothetical protein
MHQSTPEKSSNPGDGAHRRLSGLDSLSDENLRAHLSHGEALRVDLSCRFSLRQKCLVFRGQYETESNKIHSKNPQFSPTYGKYSALYHEDQMATTLAQLGSTLGELLTCLPIDFPACAATSLPKQKKARATPSDAFKCRSWRVKERKLLL